MKRDIILKLSPYSMGLTCLVFLTAMLLTSCQHEDELDVGNRFETANLPEVTDAEKERPPIITMVFTAKKNAGLDNDVTASVDGLNLSADFTSAKNANFDATKLKVEATFSGGVMNIAYPTDNNSSQRNTILDFSGSSIEIPIVYKDFSKGSFTYNLNFSF